MHPYSTDESRVPVYSTLAVVAVAASWVISAATADLSWPQWLVSTPSLAGVYGLGYWWFDEHGWRMGFARFFRLSGVEDVSGRYEGVLTSTFKHADGTPVTREVEFEITQTWTKIAIHMTVATEESSSRSTSALGSVTRDGSASQLSYVYRNMVNPGIADADMGDHDGAATLLISSDDTLTGRYFNSRPRAGTSSHAVSPSSRPRQLTG